MLCKCTNSFKLNRKKNKSMIQYELNSNLKFKSNEKKVIILKFKDYLKQI